MTSATKAMQRLKGKVALIALDESFWLTGAALPLDGGLTAY